MKSPDGLRVKPKRASSPLNEDADSVTVESRSVQQKKPKFKSPLPIARPHIAEDRIDFGCKLSPELSSQDARKRKFGTDATNVEPHVESRSYVRTAQKKIMRSCDEQSSDMPGFSGILEDIYKIFPEVTVKMEPSGEMSDHEKNAALQPKHQDFEGDNTTASRERTPGSTLESTSDKEKDGAGYDLRREDLRKESLQSSANAVRSPAATMRSTIHSKFKMPAQVRSVCEAQEISEITPNVQVTPVRPQLFRNPYRQSTTPIGSAKASENCYIAEKIVSDYYSVMYCIRKPNAKHKGPWFDGVLVRRGRSSSLQDSEGKEVLKDGEQRGGALSEGDTLFMGKFEVEVMGISTEQEFSSERISQGADDLPSVAVAKVVQRRPFRSFQPPSLKHARVSINTDEVNARELPTSKVKPVLRKDALVLNAKDLRGDCSPVAVDPWLASKLRPHQRGGVKFMYECVMGLRNSSFTGCLLADAMGLGKTLQVIALIWTLIKQGPGGHPAVRRVLVICPSSLVENWGKEVRKWLGNERLPPLIIHSGTPAKEAKRKLSSFQAGNVYHLLITSYELLRKYKDDLNAAKPGLLVCDEAHRLKNCAGNKTIDSLLELKCSKRLILTGTPIQNDLLEFYAMIDFVNPNLLGTLSTFKRLFANPIEKSRDRDASENEKILGRERSAELQSMTRFCILQRAADVNAKYLPPKTEYVVFCMLQPFQVCLYQNFLKSKPVNESLASGQSAFVLSAIGTLRKLCNHPILVQHELDQGNGHITGYSSKNGDGLKQPNRRQDSKSVDWTLSGKLSCLQRLLLAVNRSSTSGARDKMVVVSNFTQTLDIIQIMCEGQGWCWLRLDGATNVSERQAMVDRFNAEDSDHSLFLLSSKAGGSGLNLIGANRLVLFDPDWNPATDAQAMARVWRDGQKKSVFIYRLLTTASIEEKIYQRQIMKGEVAAAVEEHVEGESSGSERGSRRHFSREELRELFTLNMETSCDTYDLLSRSESSRSESWRDYSNEVEDYALKEAIQTGVVTFVHQKTFVKDIFSSLENICKLEDSKLEEQTGGLDISEPQFSFVSDVLVDEIDISLDSEQKVGDPQTDDERKTIMPLPVGRQPTNSSSSTYSKIENTEDCDTKTINVSSVAPDVLVDEMGEQKPDCNEQIASPIHRELKSIIGSKDERLPDNCSSCISSKIVNTPEKIGDANKSQFLSSTDNISGDELDDLDYKSLPARNSSILFEGDGNARQSGNARKHDLHNDEVYETLYKSDVQAACPDQDENTKSMDLEDERSVVSNPDRPVTKTKLNTENKRDGSAYTNSGDVSPAPINVGEVFDCLLESRSQKILELIVNLPSPDDEWDEVQLEDLDAPFLCSLDLEIEMKKASFAPEDLWQGFKLFAIGFLLEIKEQRESYRNSKLGLILNKCNLDKIADDESIFCKGFPMVRAVLSKRDGHRVTDLSHLFSKFEREEHLQTTSSGRFTLALVRRLNKIKMKKTEKA